MKRFIDKPLPVLLRRPLAPVPLAGSEACVLPLSPDWETENINCGEMLVLRTKLSLLPSCASGHLLLRLDSVGCYALLRINGENVYRHTGSYTVWDCPLDYPLGGELELELELKSGEDIFSPFQNAGILRSLSLLVLPDIYISAFTVTSAGVPGATSLIADYAVAGEVKIGDRGDVLCTELFDSSGNLLGQWDLDILKGRTELPCPQAHFWEPSSPELYTLRLSLKRNGRLLEAVEKRTGFTAIKREDPRVLWNGKALKLLGLNYREPLPHEGRDLRAELKIFKKAHVNYLRSMYYPYSEEALSLCDEIGFFVEQCAPFYEVGRGIAPVQSTPGEAEAFYSQFQEMFRDGISHPSVAIWCLGSNSNWGPNFRAGRTLARETDGKRLVNFHYPMTIPEEEDEPDVWSVAYIDTRQAMDVCYDQMTIFHTEGTVNEIGYATGEAPWSKKPVLHTAFGMIPCYNRDETERDYGIHEFWGEGLPRFRDKMLAAEGCLGGAIMAAVDENGSFSARLSEHNWGILDCRGKPKPEYHHVHMAFALGEAGGSAGKNTGPVSQNHALFRNGGPYTITENGDLLGIRNRFFSFDFSRGTGLLVKAALLDETSGDDILLLVGGPCLQATRLTLGPWRGRIEGLQGEWRGVTLVISGEYEGVCSLRFTLNIGTDGTIRTAAKIVSLQKPMPHSVQAGVMKSVTACFCLRPLDSRRESILCISASAARKVHLTGALSLREPMCRLINWWWKVPPPDRQSS
jgi:hypothetical protein